MLKKYIAVLLIFVMTFTLIPFNVFAEVPIKIVLNGKEVSTAGAEPFIDANSRMQVPVRFISEAMGAVVDWDATTRAISIKRNATEIKLNVDSPIISVNGINKSLDTAPIIKGDRTFVPVRFVSEALGASVEWLADICTVKITIADGAVAADPDNIAYDPKDFDPAYLRPSANVFELNSNVKKVDAAPSTNVLTMEDDENGYYVLDNITPEIAALKIDDILAIYPCESVPRGLYLKVKDIKITGNKAELWRNDMKFEEVIEKIDISKVIEIPLDKIDVSQLPEGVKLVANDAHSDIVYGGALIGIDKNSIIYDDLGNVVVRRLQEQRYLPISKNDFSAESTLTFSVEKEFAKDQKLKGTVIIASPKLAVDIETNNVFGVPVGLKTASVKVENKSGFEADYKSKIESENNLEFPLFKASTVIPGTPLLADITAKVVVGLEGECSITYSNTIVNTLGLDYRNGKAEFIKKSDRESNINVDAKAKLSAGPELEAGISLPFVISFSVDGKVGIAAVAQMAKKPVNSGNDAKEVHIDLWCVDGDIYFYLGSEIKGTLGSGSFKVNLFSIKDKVEIAMGDFYVSRVSLEDMIQFGLGECPNIFEVPKIIASPKSIEVPTGNEIRLSVDAEVKNDKQVIGYQWQKDGTDIPGATNATLYIQSAASQDAGTYVCVVYDTKFKDILNTSSQAAEVKLSDANANEIPDIYVPDFQ